MARKTTVGSGMNTETLERLLAASDLLVRAEKEHAMIYQADLKDQVAVATGRARQKLYVMPYDEWALIRDAYLAANAGPMLMKQNPLTGEWLCWIPDTAQAYYCSTKGGAEKFCAQANADFASGKLSVVGGKLVVQEELCGGNLSVAECDTGL